MQKSEKKDISNAVAWCDRVMVFSICALTYFLPISIALVESFFGVALVSHFVKRGFIFALRLREMPVVRAPSPIFQKIKVFLRSFKPADSALSWPIAIFLLAGFLSIFVSGHKIMSIKGFFFKLLEWTYLYFMVVECITSKKRLKVLVTVFVISSTIATLNGLVQYLTGQEFIWGRALFTGRISSSFRHPNDFGGYLVIVCPLLFSFLWHYPGAARNRWEAFQGFRQNNPSGIFLLRFLFLILFVLSVFDLGGTYSRGAWVSFFISLLYMGNQRRKLILIPILIIVVFMGYFSPRMEDKRKVSLVTDDTALQKESLQVNSSGLPQSAQEHDDTQGSWIDQIWEPFKHFTGSGRSTFWAEALPIIRSSPIVGVGINTYAQVVKGRAGYPHNCYLQLAAEMGLFGLGAFLWISTMLFLGAGKCLRKLDDAFLFFVLAGSIAGLMGFLVHSAVDTNFYSVQLGNLMWLVMGIIAAVGKIDERIKVHENVGGR